MLIPTLKKLLPSFIIKFLRDSKNNLLKSEFNKMNNYDIFKKIYLKKIWTPEQKKKNFKFYSGTGSHEKEFTEVYLKKVENFLNSFPTKPDVVDLGCGDFEIGSKLRKFCNKYTAVDIFDELINHNKKKFNNYNVEFLSMDITKDNLPKGDICFLRTVLQHLSNDSIKSFLILIKDKYKYLVLTEHLPNLKNFKSNVDMPTSSFIRLDKKSGVILTDPPFNLKVVKQITLCNLQSNKISNFEGVVNTKILQLT